jgi:hypothetical protein
MKHLSTLFCAFALLFTTAATANAAVLNLQLESYSSDAPGYEQRCCTHLFGYKTGDDINVGADIFLTDLSVSDATLLVYWYSDPEHQIYDSVASGPIDADYDVAMLNAGITLPPGATGTVYTELTVYFVNGSQINHFEFAVLD